MPDHIVIVDRTGLCLAESLDQECSTRRLLNGRNCVMAFLSQHY